MLRNVRYKRKTAKKFILGMLMVIFFAGSMPTVAYATASTQQQITQVENEINNLEQQQEAQEQELQGLKGEKSTLQKKLQSLNDELTAISTQLTYLEQQIVEKEAEIAETQANLEDARQLEVWQYACMEKRIQYTYESGTTDWLTAIFNAKNFATILNFSTYIESIVSYDDRMLEEIIDNREYIESEEARLAGEKEELDILKINAEAEKSKVNGLIDEVRNSISDYTDQIEDAEAAALAYEKALKEKEEDLEYLKKKLAEEIALSQAAANAAWRDISEVTFAERDRYLLANLIYCEAGGEPYEGQVAVGAVVINRVLSSKFPDTVVGVIYQSKQFSPVASGRLELALAVNKATDSCYRAADQAMAGVTNVGSCLFFRTPIDGLTGITIGGHVFY